MKIGVRMMEAAGVFWQDHVVWYSVVYSFQCEHAGGYKVGCMICSMVRWGFCFSIVAARLEPLLARGSGAMFSKHIFRGGGGCRRAQYCGWKGSRCRGDWCDTRREIPGLYCVLAHFR